MTNNERIEAYFNNEIPEADKQQLMQDIESDASLKSEFQFQQGVIDGIKDYRKKELISRLDNIQVASTGQSIILKTLGIAGIATVVTIGSYMWINQGEEVIANEETNNTEQLVAQPEENTEKVVDSFEDKSLAEENNPNKEVESVKEEEIAEAAPAKTDKEEIAFIPDVVVPNVQEPETDSTVSLDEDLSAPEAIASSTTELSTRSDVQVKLSKKYEFHYQIKNGGLILYGKFNDSPFEVIELKTNQGINSYLYFKNQFYSLTDKSEDINPLVILTNKELIKELEKRR